MFSSLTKWTKELKNKKTKEFLFEMTLFKK